MELRWTCFTQPICSKTLVTKAQFSLPLISILNSHGRDSSSRYFVRASKPSALSKQGQQRGCEVSQSWWCVLPKLNSPRCWTLGTCLQPKVKTAHICRGAISPTLFTAFSVSKVVFLFVLNSVSPPPSLFFVFHHFSWFPVLSVADILIKLIFLCCVA